MPPLLDWVVSQYQAAPILTVVIGLIALAVLLYILKSAVKIFLIVIVLLIAAILLSYFLRGPEETKNSIQQGVEQIEKRVLDGQEGQEEPAR